ncbi:unnamed protein product [Brachionus calyciflorus]|uniref:Uncharacterized protein n=1 Tax=Brachionus calyciflorus TaxID=104777 RepID=A0A813PQT0_9BILA|nr:unnamed protein product [Brachionus calyciflorus]
MKQAADILRLEKETAEKLAAKVFQKIKFRGFPVIKMITSEFIKYFDENSKQPKFFFSSFKFEILDRITPNKMELPYINGSTQFSLLFRDCIISNLGINPYFYEKDGHRTDHFSKLIEILKENRYDEYLNEDQKGKLSFLVHFSKSLCDTADEWDDFFYRISSLTIVNQTDPQLKNFYAYYKQIQSSKSINKRIRKAVELVTGKTTEGFLNFSDIKLNFFNSIVVGLNGFAGTDCIYVSHSSIKNFIQILSSNGISDENIRKLVKLNFTRIIIHEICHVFIRKTLNNFNLSSPKIFSLGKEENLIFGVFAEKQIFQERISWIKSIFSSKFNMAYCWDFLEKILDGDDLIFDFKNSGCVLNTSKIKYMAIDFEESYDLL